MVYNHPQRGVYTFLLILLIFLIHQLILFWNYFLSLIDNSNVCLEGGFLASRVGMMYVHNEAGDGTIVCNVISYHHSQ